jgi:uncharacterized protein YbaR (Trm112 family)
MNDETVKPTLVRSDLTASAYCATREGNGRRANLCPDCLWYELTTTVDTNYRIAVADDQILECGLCGNRINYGAAAELACPNGHSDDLFLISPAETAERVHSAVDGVIEVYSDQAPIFLGYEHDYLSCAKCGAKFPIPEGWHEKERIGDGRWFGVLPGPPVKYLDHSVSYLMNLPSEK